MLKGEQKYDELMDVLTELQDHYVPTISQERSETIPNSTETVKVMRDHFDPIVFGEYL